jgi:hypothetical protein
MDKPVLLTLNVMVVLLEVPALCCWKWTLLLWEPVRLLVLHLYWLILVQPQPFQPDLWLPSSPALSTCVEPG